jgi:hypothetical protein
MARETSSSAPVGAGRVVLRVLAIVVGGYAASAALVAAAVASLRLAGVVPSDAFTLCSILGFLVYLVLALWAATEQRLPLLVASLLLLTVGGAGMATMAALIGRP